MNDVRTGDSFNTWIGKGILVAIPIFAIGVAINSSLLLKAGVVGVLGCALAVWWIAVRPECGLLLLLVAGLTIPYSISTISATGLSPTLLILGLLVPIWIFRWMREDWNELLSYRVLWALLAFCAVSVVAFISGLEPLDPFAESAPLRAQAGQLAVILLSGFALVFTAGRIKSVKWLKILCSVFLGISAIYIFGRLLPPVGLFTRQVFCEGATGALFWVWAVSLAIGQALLNRRLRWFGRFPLVVLALATLSVAFFQTRSWASGWAPAALALGVILVLARPAIGLSGMVVAAALLLWKLDLVKSVLMAGDQTYSLMTRIEAGQLLLEHVWHVSPLLGLGPANYYFYAPGLKILGWYVNFSSHNNFIDIFAQTGLLGLGCFLWFVFEMAVLGWHLLEKVPGGFSTGLAAGGIGGLLGTLAAGFLGDWILPFVFNVTMEGMRASLVGWIFLGCLVALDRIVKDQACFQEA